MNHKTFFWFFLPTALAMILFIALPLTSIVSQSVHTPHDKVLLTVESCDPFGCKTSTTIDQEATRKLKEEKPLGKFVGSKIYLDRGHLAINEVAELFGKDYPREYISARKGEYDVTLCDYQTASKLLKWKPKKDIKDYIKKWLEENKND